MDLLAKVVKEFDYVMIKKEANMKIFQIVSNKYVTMCKEKFCLNGVIGNGYGSSYKVLKGNLIKVDISELSNDYDKDEDAVDYGRDNRNLTDKRENQRLSKEEIHDLRKQGVTGDEIVEQLIENSSTFQDKTEFAQQKYIQKKKRKHVSVFTVLKPSTRNLVEMYYGRGPTKICNLRMDSLAQILTQANVRAHSKLMIVETCCGLVVGSTLERMSGLGSLVHLYTGSAPNRPALVDGYRFNEEYLKCLSSFPIDQIASLDRSSTCDAYQHAAALSGQLESNTTDNKAAEMVSIPCTPQPPLDDHESSVQIVINNQEDEVKETKKREAEFTICDDEGKPGSYKRLKLEDAEEREERKRCRLEQIQKAKTIIEMADMDGLIVAAKLHPTPIVMSLIDFVLPSRPIVVFCPYREPLVDCFIKLREKGNVLMLKLTETWLREYQVLPNRTHPSINMSGSGGYLLTAMTVEA